MKLSDLTSHLAAWLEPTGPSGDVVVSTRARLARNLAGMPFLSRCTSGQVREVAGLLRSTLLELPLPGQALYIDVEQADPMDRQLLVERHLISRQHAEGKGPRGVAIGGGETVAAMVNEEDHLRLQVLTAGLDLDGGCQQLRDLEAQLEQRLEFSFSSQLGYLTACPTNVGTGLRVSLMLHLPALKMTGQLEKALRAARDMHMWVRGLYGEGTEAVGDFFQVSNQTTLGRTEERIIRDFRDQVAPELIRYERTARQALSKNRRMALEDKVHRALAVLRSARLMSSEEAMYLLSHLRLGLAMGLVEGVSPRAVNELSIIIQPAHLQRFFKRPMPPAERGAARATLIRQKLGAT